MTLALDRCREVAEWAYGIAEREMDAVRQNAKTMQERFADDFHKLASAVLPIKDDWNQLQGEMERRVAEELESKVQELALKRGRLEKFTITIFGKTDAGKRTLTETLLKGDGSTIGKGGQNTTKPVRECLWRGLHILDTPGIGAPGAEDFETEAKMCVRASDLVLFVATDDRLEENEIIGLKSASAEVKPMLFVLNIKKNLHEKTYLKRFLRNPDADLVNEDVDAHKQRLKKQMRKHLGIDDVSVFPVQLMAAQLATTAHEDADALFRACGISNLNEALRQEIVSSGPSIRLRTFLDGTSRDLRGLRDFYRFQAAHLERVRETVASLKSEYVSGWEKWKEHYKTTVIPDASLKCVEIVRSVLKPRLAERKTWKKADLSILWNSICNGPTRENAVALFKAATLEGIRRELIEPILSSGFPSTNECHVQTEKASFCDDRKGYLESLKGREIFKSAVNAAFCSIRTPAPQMIVLNFLFGPGVEIAKQTIDYHTAAHSNLHNVINANLEILEQTTQKQLESWFEKDVQAQMRLSLRIFDKAMDFFQRSARSLENGAKSLETIILRLDQHLVAKLAGLNGLHVPRSRIAGIEREPGQTIHITLEAGTYPPDLGIVIEKNLNERVTITTLPSEYKKSYEKHSKI